MSAGNTAVARSGDWLTANIDGELVMMSAETGQYVGLSATGARIWELLESASSLESLCDRLTEEYDVSRDQAVQDVTQFLRELSRYGAVTLNSDANP